MATTNISLQENCDDLQFKCPSVPRNSWHISRKPHTSVDRFHFQAFLGKSSCACFSQCERWMRSDQVTVWLDYHGFFVEKTDKLNLEEISMCKKSPSLIHCLISYGNVIYYHKHNEICSCFTFLYVSPCSSTQRGHT